MSITGIGLLVQAIHRTGPEPSPAADRSPHHEVVAKTLHQLRDLGCQGAPEQLLAAAVRLGWSGHPAWALQEVAVLGHTAPGVPTPAGCPALQLST